MKPKKQKREEAKTRQEAYDKLSVSQKMAKLPKDGSERQRSKLLGQASKEKKAEKETVTVV